MKLRFIFCALLLAISCFPVHAQKPNIFLDDDCVFDPDCAITESVLHKLADRGEINILAMVTNGANPLSATAMKIFNTYYGRPNIPIGANKTGEPAGGLEDSPWLGPLATAFAPDDPGTEYEPCTRLYRQTLAAAQPSSVTIVETGFLTCLNQLLQSPADGISAMTGAQLIKAKVLKLCVMGSSYPTGTDAPNFGASPADTHAVFATWTTQNGFPPIYVVAGAYADSPHDVEAGPPSFASLTVNPVLKALNIAGDTTRGAEDAIALLFAARGFTYNGTPLFGDVGDGSVTVNASTGANVWSTSPHAGQHVILYILTDDEYEQIVDGHSHRGFAGMPPHAASGMYIH